MNLYILYNYSHVLAGVTLAGATGQLSLHPPPTTPLPHYLLHLHTYNRVLWFWVWVLLFFNYSLPSRELLSLHGKFCKGVSQHHTFQPWCSAENSFANGFET